MAEDTLESYDRWRPGRLLLKPDPGYLASRRAKHRNAALGMGLIAILSLVGYLGFGAMFPTLLSLSELVFGVMAMMLALAGYILVVRSEAYLKYEFIDVAPFLLVGVAQFGVNASFFEAAARFGTSAVNIITFNAAALIAAGSIIVVGSFRSFVTILIAYVAMVVGYAIVSAQNVWHLTQAAPFATMLAAALYTNFYAEIVSRISYGRREVVREQAAQIKELLDNVLPPGIVERLNKGEIVADAHPKVAVIFADIVSFTEMAKDHKLSKLVTILRAFFEAADGCAQGLAVEKVKTIGDAYMAVAGSQGSSENCASTAVEFGVRLLKAVETVRCEMGLERLDLRIGIHTGSAVGAVIGQTRQVYDYWGETVNIASRIQTRADPNVILVSDQTYQDARHDFAFLAATTHNLKGVGEVRTYALAGGA